MKDRKEGEELFALPTDESFVGMVEFQGKLILASNRNVYVVNADAGTLIKQEFVLRGE